MSGLWSSPSRHGVTFGPFHLSARTPSTAGPREPRSGTKLRRGSCVRGRVGRLGAAGVPRVARYLLLLSVFSSAAAVCLGGSQTPPAAPREDLRRPRDGHLRARLGALLRPARRLAHGPRHQHRGPGSAGRRPQAPEGGPETPGEPPILPGPERLRCAHLLAQDRPRHDVLPRRRGPPAPARRRSPGGPGRVRARVQVRGARKCSRESAADRGPDTPPLLGRRADRRRGGDVVGPRRYPLRRARDVPGAARSGPGSTASRGEPGGDRFLVEAALPLGSTPSAWSPRRRTSR